MKTCPVCGSALSDEAQFCVCCGSSVSAQAPVAPDIAEPVAPVTPVAPIVPEIPDYAAAPVAVETAPDYSAEPTEKPAKKNGKGKMIALISIAAVLVAALVFVIIGFATDWFKSPMEKLMAAIEKTLNANSLTTEHKQTVKYEYDGDEYTEKDKRTAKYVINKDDRTVASLVVVNDNTYLTIDNKEYCVNDEDVDEYYYAYIIEDLKAEAGEDANLDYFFDFLDAVYSHDEKAIEELLKGDKVDASADDVVHFLEVLKKDYFGNNEWVEKNLGFTVDGSEYKMEFSLDDLMEEIMDIAVDCDVVKKSVKKDLLDEITYKSKLEITFTLKDGYISTIEYTENRTYSESDNKYKFTGKCEITDINNTELTQKEINKVIDRTNAILDEYYAECTGCNDLNKKEYLEIANSKYYCYECYYERDYCDICDEFVLEETLEYINYRDRCKDCADEYKAENYVNCTACKVSKDKKNMYTANSKYYCSDCYYDRDYCYGCDDFVEDSTLTYIKYHYYCPDCAENLQECYYCGNYYSTNSMNHHEDHYYCSSCYSKFGYCHRCGDWAYMRYWRGYYYCEPCYWIV